MDKEFVLKLVDLYKYLLGDSLTSIALYTKLDLADDVAVLTYGNNNLYIFKYTQPITYTKLTQSWSVKYIDIRDYLHNFNMYIGNDLLDEKPQSVYTDHVKSEHVEILYSKIRSKNKWYNRLRYGSPWSTAQVDIDKYYIKFNQLMVEIPKTTYNMLYEKTLIIEKEKTIIAIDGIMDSDNSDRNIIEELQNRIDLRNLNTSDALDMILDKVSRMGIDSLTAYELQYLKNIANDGRW